MLRSLSRSVQHADTSNRSCISEACEASLSCDVIVPARLGIKKLNFARVLHSLSASLVAPVACIHKNYYKIRINTVY